MTNQGAFFAAMGQAFLLVFLAELGDKTQIATLGLAVRGGSVTAVFLGAGLALVASTLLACLVGQWFGRAFPVVAVRTLGGLLLVGSGGWLLVETWLRRGGGA